MAFLGENLILWLLLVLGGALSVGNLLALVRPRNSSTRANQTKSNRDRAKSSNVAKSQSGSNASKNEPTDRSKQKEAELTNTGREKEDAKEEISEDLPKAPIWRSVLMIVFGTAITIWALASLLEA